MYKIYSRKRIKIPKIRKLREIKGGKLIKIAIIIFFIIIAIRFILNTIIPTFNNLCENKAKSIATIISNEKATEVMKEHSYEDLFEIQKDNQGNIQMIKSNIYNINQICSDIATKIQTQIDNKERDDIEIALGSFTGLKLLSGKGPGIKIKISTIGNVETNLKSEFSSQGINQTLHRVYLEVSCEASVITPFEDIKTQITNQILLAENVIMGNIPSTYYNLQGINGTSDALKTIQ